MTHRLELPFDNQQPAQRGHRRRCVQDVARRFGVGQGLVQRDARRIGLAGLHHHRTGQLQRARPQQRRGRIGVVYQTWQDAGQALVFVVVIQPRGVRQGRLQAAHRYRFAAVGASRIDARASRVGVHSSPPPLPCGGAGSGPSRTVSGQPSATANRRKVSMRVSSRSPCSILRISDRDTPEDSASSRCVSPQRFRTVWNRSPRSMSQGYGYASGRPRGRSLRRGFRRPRRALPARWSSASRSARGPIAERRIPSGVTTSTGVAAEDGHSRARGCSSPHFSIAYRTSTRLCPSSVSS